MLVLTGIEADVDSDVAVAYVKVHTGVSIEVDVGIGFVVLLELLVSALISLTVDTAFVEAVSGFPGLPRALGAE